MGDKVVEFITSAKVIIGMIAIVFSGFVYSFDYVHEKFITKKEVKNILSKHEIIDLQNTIIDLQINRGYAATKHELMRYDTLIKVKQAQILKYRER